MAIDISIIIVNWNTRKVVSNCLRAIREAASDISKEIIVVDNASSDDSVVRIKSDFPEVAVIENKSNKGFAAANNQGYNTSRGKFILFLNSDTIVQRGSLQSMVSLLENHHDAGLCSCRLLNSDGSIQPNVRHFPSFRAMLFRYTFFKYLGLFKADRAFYRMRRFPYNEISQVDQVTGAVMMAKRSLLEKIGCMDEKLFMYFEETDLCYRIKEAGAAVYFTPDGEITHLGRASSDKVDSYKVQAIFFKSLFYYFRKHKGKARTFFFACVFKPGLFIYLTCEIFTGLLLGAVGWGLKLDSHKVSRRFERARESALFLIRYGVSFLLLS